ncbi:MAG: hypothetical protein ABI411_14375 [Tahibacter sp.]
MEIFPGRFVALARRRAVQLALALTMLHCGFVNIARADDAAAVAVTPYRPTVSNPADLPLPGWIEAEFGGLRVLGEDRTRGDSVPWLLKYAFDADHGLLLGGDAYVTSQAPGEREQRGSGDTTLAWKQRFAFDDATAFGIEAGVTVPTAKRELGVGKPVYLMNGIVSRDFGSVHMDLNVGAAHSTQRATGTSAWQQSYAIAVSRSLTPAWGAALEVSGARQRGAPSESQALAAVTYALSPRVVLDAGVARGITPTRDRSFFTGAAILLGRLR